MTTEFKDIDFTIDNGIATITINRPQVYNALQKASKLEIVKAIKMAIKTSSVKCIVLTANGKAFCSGQDLNDRSIQVKDGESVNLGDTLKNEWNPLVMAIRSCPKIIIASINGVCAGAGLSVALACDILLTSPKVKFISGFSKLGLVSDAGSTYTLTKALGSFRALNFFLLNKPLLAEELKTLGVITDISENLPAITTEYANKITQLPPLAVTALKHNIQKSLELSYAESIENELITQRFLGDSADYQEGLQAFFEKRTAHFQGK